MLAIKPIQNVQKKANITNIIAANKKKTECLINNKHEVGVNLDNNLKDQKVRITSPQMKIINIIKSGTLLFIYSQSGFSIVFTEEQMPKSFLLFHDVFTQPLHH